METVLERVKYRRASAKARSPVMDRIQQKFKMKTDSAENDVRSSQELLAFALAPSCEEYSDEYWSAVRVLQCRMDESLFEEMSHHLVKGNARQRQLAADVIAQSRLKDHKFSEACVELLLESLKQEASAKVLAAICHALGHHKSPKAVSSLAKLQIHPDTEVRLAVVHGLSCQDDPVAISALISLSADLERDVRDWATFGLGSMTDLDSVPIREALVKRLSETDVKILGEALVGLALRGDIRVVQPLLKRISGLDRESHETDFLLIEALLAVRSEATKHPNEAWAPLLAKCDELGLINPAK